MRLYIYIHRLELQQEEEASHLYTLPHTLQHTLQHMVLRQDEVLPRTLPRCPQMQQRRQQQQHHNNHTHKVDRFKSHCTNKLLCTTLEITAHPACCTQTRRRHHSSSAITTTRKRCFAVSCSVLQCLAAPAPQPHTQSRKSNKVALY